jgi:GGDEF domain-containing protein
MRVFDRVSSSTLERRESELILLACAAIVSLAVGVAVLMYPVLFFSADNSSSRSLSFAFVGFCALSALLAGYLIDRQTTIHRLRRQIEDDRAKASNALMQAHTDFLEAMPNFRAFQNQLPVELRRTAAAKEDMSVLVITVQTGTAFSDPAQRIPAVGDAGKAIARKLGEEDAIYRLQPDAFGVILPRSDPSAAQRIVQRISEGLADASGAINRFSFKIHAISFPDQTSSAYDLELAIRGWLPEDGLAWAAQEKVLVQ